MMESGIFTSSTSVYPQTDGSEVTEDSPADPDRETAQILRETEELILSKEGTVLRLAGLYGPRRSVHLERFLQGTATIEEDIEASRRKWRLRKLRVASKSAQDSARPPATLRRQRESATAWECGSGRTMRNVRRRTIHAARMPVTS